MQSSSQHIDDQNLHLSHSNNKQETEKDERSFRELVALTTENEEMEADGDEAKVLNENDLSASFEQYDAIVLSTCRPRETPPPTSKSNR